MLLPTQIHVQGPALIPVLLYGPVLSPVLPAQVLPCDPVLDPVCSPVLLPGPPPIPLPTQTAPVQDPVPPPTQTALVQDPVQDSVQDPVPLLLFTLCIRILRTGQKQTKNIKNAFFACF